MLFLRTPQSVAPKEGGREICAPVRPGCGGFLSRCGDGKNGRGGPRWTDIRFPRGDIGVSPALAHPLRRRVATIWESRHRASSMVKHWPFQQRPGLLGSGCLLPSQSSSRRRPGNCRHPESRCFACSENSLRTKRATEAETEPFQDNSLQNLGWVGDGTHRKIRCGQPPKMEPPGADRQWPHYRGPGPGARSFSKMT